MEGGAGPGMNRAGGAGGGSLEGWAGGTAVAGGVGLNCMVGAGGGSLQGGAGETALAAEAGGAGLVYGTRGPALAADPADRSTLLLACERYMEISMSELGALGPALRLRRVAKA